MELNGNNIEIMALEWLEITTDGNTRYNNRTGTSITDVIVVTKLPKENINLNLGRSHRTRLPHLVYRYTRSSPSYSNPKRRHTN